MLLKFPKNAEDWLSNWKQTLVITLTIRRGKKIPVKVESVEPFLYSLDRKLACVQATLAGEAFYLCFDEMIPELRDEVAFCFSGNEVRKGYWNVPDRYKSGSEEGS